jgi:hypothetical protein
MKGRRRRRRIKVIKQHSLPNEYQAKLSRDIVIAGPSRHLSKKTLFMPDGFEIRATWREIATAQQAVFV